LVEYWVLLTRGVAPWDGLLALPNLAPLRPQLTVVTVFDFSPLAQNQ